MTTLPTKYIVKNSFKCLNVKRITLRNNQYIITVPFAGYFSACELAETFGISNTASKHQFVKINIA